MCCDGHDHGTHEVERRVDLPETPALASASCPECGYPTQEAFVLCPRCGTELLTACPECHRAVQIDWAHCAYCGADLVAG
jgi:RNA polymerase subunit RPABC4/transcription elongation factor Spt4